MQIIGMIVNL